MKLPKFLHFFTPLWNSADAERGLFWGLIAGTILAAIIDQTDGAQYVNPALYHSQFPYGVLWYALNFMFATPNFYKLQVVGELFATVTFQYWLVKKDRLPKSMFYLSWFICIVWMRSTMFQNVTVTMFTPFAFINPIFILIPIFQKLPLGWSLIPWNNVHWQCAFDKYLTSGTDPNGAPYIICSTAANRLNIDSGQFWQYAVLGFMFLYPVVAWYLVRRKRSHKCSACENCTCGQRTDLE